MGTITAQVRSAMAGDAVTELIGKLKQEVASIKG